MDFKEAMLVLSDLLSARFTILVALWLIIWSDANWFEYLLVGALFVTIFPALFGITVIESKRVYGKTITGDEAKTRFKYWAFGGGMQVVAGVILKLMGAPEAAAVLLFGTGIGAILGAIPTAERWKISAHAQAASASLTVLLMSAIVPIEAAVLFMGIIYANRIYLDAHSREQLIVGTAVGIIVTLLTPSILTALGL
jgi:hypothetical protein